MFSLSLRIFGNRRKYQFCYLEKGGLELHRAATIKPRKIERSGFFLLDHNGQTWIYRLVWGPTEVRFQRNRDFPTGGSRRKFWVYISRFKQKILKQTFLETVIFETKFFETILTQWIRNITTRGNAHFHHFSFSSFDKNFLCSFAITFFTYMSIIKWALVLRIYLVIFNPTLTGWAECLWPFKLEFINFFQTLSTFSAICASMRRLVFLLISLRHIIYPPPQTWK